jgi:hypothetical protein
MDEVAAWGGGGAEDNLVRKGPNVIFCSKSYSVSLYSTLYVFRFLHTYFNEHFGAIEKLNLMRLTAFHGKKH